MYKIFDNTEIAFALKSNSELERAYYLFKMIQSKPLVKIGTFATTFALNAHLPVEGIIRATVFDHFCGGVNEQDCLKVVDKMATKNVHTILDYSVEGKEEDEQFDNALQMTLKTIEFAKEHQSIPFAVFKPTGFGRLALYEKAGNKSNLTTDETSEWQRVINRFETVCKAAFEADVPLLIDAEESWMQDAADELVEQMMMKYNKIKPLIFNTLQLYRWDRLAYLKDLHQRAIEHDFYIGMKLVRGAYMEKENERATENNYPTPICATKQETDKNYDNTLAYMLENSNRMAVYIGTHNEESSYFAMQKLAELNIAKNYVRVWFGQLYGMSDHITYNLAETGYNVSKYLPFGPVRDVMPYLIRRAEENTSVAGQTSRELTLLTKERERRKIV